MGVRPIHPVFARLVEAFPKIPEESKTCAFRKSRSGRHSARQAPCFSSETSCSTPISLADCYQNHPHESSKTLFSFFVTDAQDAFRSVPSGRPKKTGRPSSLRRDASPREERFAKFVQSAQFALQSVGVVPMTEAQAKPGHPAELARSLRCAPRDDK